MTRAARAPRARFIAAWLVIPIAMAGCQVRAAIPQPLHPLAATPAEALPEPPSEPLEEEPFRLRLERRELENGLSILISRGEPNGVVSVVFADRTVATWDSRAPAPVTETLAAAMFRATQTAEGTVAHDLLESRGFSPEIVARPAGVLVAERLAAEELPAYLEGLERSLRHPVFRPEDLRFVLDARIERLAGHVLTPDGLIADRIPSMLYAPEDPRATSIVGRLEILRSLDVGALSRRHAQALDPRECAVVIAGDAEPLDVVPLIAERFGTWEARGSMPALVPPRHREEGPRGLVIVQPLVRTYLKIVERAPPLGHDDHAAFLVLEQLLGGMFGARLNLTLRERHGISYGFHAVYAPSATEGELEMVTAIDPAYTQTVAEAMLHELRRVRGEEGAGVESFELSLAKTRAREILLAELDTSLGLAVTIGERWLAGLDPETLRSVLGRIDGMDAAALHAAARRWLRPDRAPMVAVGRADVASALRAAGAGALEVIQAPERHRR